jgi:serine/threonine protein kinase
MIPDQIGRYEVLELLGRTAMGDVYRAYAPSLRREVALKLVIPPDQIEADKWRQRFQREAQAAACLNHPHNYHCSRC